MAFASRFRGGAGGAQHYPQPRPHPTAMSVQGNSEYSFVGGESDDSFSDITSTTGSSMSMSMHSSAHTIQQPQMAGVGLERVPSNPAALAAAASRFGDSKSPVLEDPFADLAASVSPPPMAGPSSSAFPLDKKLPPGAVPAVPGLTNRGPGFSPLAARFHRNIQPNDDDAMRPMSPATITTLPAYSFVSDSYAPPTPTADNHENGDDASQSVPSLPSTPKAKQAPGLHVSNPTAEASSSSSSLPTPTSAMQMPVPLPAMSMQQQAAPSPQPSQSPAHRASPQPHMQQHQQHQHQQRQHHLPNRGLHAASPSLSSVSSGSTSLSTATGKSSRMSANGGGPGSTTEDLVSTLGLGGMFVSSFEGTSQYSNGGPSACGLAAMNAVRQVLLYHKKGIQFGRLLGAMHQVQFHEEVVNICSFLTENDHLEIDELHKLPMFTHTMAFIGAEYQSCSQKAFNTLLKQLAHQSTNGAPVAAVITKSPEIIAVIRIALPPPPQSPSPAPPLPHTHAYIIFDSHSRPQVHPDGSAFLFFPTSDQAAQYLTQLLAVDEGLLQSGDLRWQSEMLTAFSAHLFTAPVELSPAEQIKAAAKGGNPNALKAGGVGSSAWAMLYETSVQLVQSRGKAIRLEHDVGESKRERDNLGASVERLRKELNVEKEKVLQLTRRAEIAERGGAGAVAAAQAGANKGGMGARFAAGFGGRGGPAANPTSPPPIVRSPAPGANMNNSKMSQAQYAQFFGQGPNGPDADTSIGSVYDDEDDVPIHLNRSVPPSSVDKGKGKARAVDEWAAGADTPYDEFSELSPEDSASSIPGAWHSSNTSSSRGTMPGAFNGSPYRGPQHQPQPQRHAGPIDQNVWNDRQPQTYQNQQPHPYANPNRGPSPMMPAPQHNQMQNQQMPMSSFSASRIGMGGMNGMRVDMGHPNGGAMGNVNYNVGGGGGGGGGMGMSGRNFQHDEDTEAGFLERQEAQDQESREVALQMQREEQEALDNARAAAAARRGAGHRPPNTFRDVGGEGSGSPSGSGSGGGFFSRFFAGGGSGSAPARPPQPQRQVQQQPQAGPSGSGSRGPVTLNNTPPRVSIGGNGSGAGPSRTGPAQNQNQQMNRDPSTVLGSPVAASSNSYLENLRQQLRQAEEEERERNRPRGGSDAGAGAWGGGAREREAKAPRPKKSAFEEDEDTQRSLDLAMRLQREEEENATEQAILFSRTLN
ncbi:hypothetical protein DL93DRAFT_1178477 [Clavulina sp. PMI_390]|nr:hypothetical protein DL93DRAFT_1178477 [Clavulina sp. PMI_390]